MKLIDNSFENFLLIFLNMTNQNNMRSIELARCRSLHVYGLVTYSCQTCEIDFSKISGRRFVSGIMCTCGVCHFKNFMTNFFQKEITISELSSFAPLC